MGLPKRAATPKKIVRACEQSWQMILAYLSPIMDKKSQQLQKHTRNIPASEPSQILVSRAAQALGVDTFTVLSLIQRDELVPTRASSGEITLPQSELIKLIGKRRWHMVKPKGQYTLSAITGLARRLNQGERNAYLAASE